MQAHAADLRAEVDLPFLRSLGIECELEEWAARVERDWRDGGFGAADAGLCRYAEKLTRTPGAMSEADVLELRELGFDDVAIHDCIQVVAYFNYINRIADGVHVDLEPEMRPYPES